MNLPELAQAWEQFINSGAVESLTVRREISDSWLRCVEAGVDPLGIQRISMDDTVVKQRLQEKNLLLDIALPFMQRLYQFVEGTGFIVILSDEKGTILELLGDEETLVKGREINLVRGGLWKEEVAGTNGIGTALALQSPVQISGEEHFCQAIHEWTCSAAPIFNVSGTLTGVLQMSGPRSKSHRHTLGMVVAAVQSIEEQLQIRFQNREMMLINKRLSNMFDTISEGVVIVDKMGTIRQANRLAELILRRPSGSLPGTYLLDIFKEDRHLKQMLADGKSYSDIEINVNFSDCNLHLVTSGKAIKDEKDEIDGGIVIFNPIKKIKNLVNRFSGAQARFNFSDIVGNSPEMKEAIRMADLAAMTDSTVLLQGESGTGKEVFAQAIHNRSSRRNGPFVALNCAAIPRELMGSELFGYVEGAFTGAYRGGRPGKFEMASGGTLFLDEIGDMTYGKQGALLRAIQEKAVTRIGDNRVIPVDVRIICATNKNVLEAVEKGNFRRDLYYRLNVLSIYLPPLSQHPSDIADLFHYFVKQVCLRQGVQINSIDPRIVGMLKKHRWPGNIRELENVVERMVCMARGSRLGVEDLPMEIRYNQDYIALETNAPSISIGMERDKKKQALEKKERLEIIELLERFGGNITRVATEMGVSRNTIYRKMKRYQIFLE